MGALLTIQADRRVLDAAKMFARTGVRRLVSAKGVLVGVIAVDDLFILLGNELGHMAGALSAGLRKVS